LAILLNVPSAWARWEPPGSTVLAQAAARPAAIEISELKSAVEQARALEAQGAFAEAAALWERILATVETQLGPQHPTTAITLSALANLVKAQGAYPRAEALYLRALAISERANGPDHLDTATALNNLAALYDIQGRAAQAEPLYLRALAIQEAGLGPEHPATANLLNNLGLLLINRAAYDRAEPLLKRALAIRERTPGPGHPDTAITLATLGVLYKNTSAFGQAESLFSRALRISETSLGPQHPITTKYLNNLAALHHSRGDFPKAEALYRRALTSMEKAQGATHPDTALALKNLALLHVDQASYSKAVPLFERALVIQRQALGPRHPETGVTLNNVGLLLLDQGAPAKAEAAFQEALAISEAALGPEHPLTARILNNLGVLYDRIGAPERAEPLLLRALAINEKVQGPEDTTTALALNNLALRYLERGDYSRAEPLYLRAIAINDRLLGAGHPSTAIYLNNLAMLHRRQGKAAQAESLYLRALAIQDKLLGPEHPSVALAVVNLALLYDSQGASARAEPLLRQGIRGQTLFLQREIPLLPESRRLPQIRSLGNAWEIAYSYAGRSPAGSDLALFTRLNRHGLLQDIERRQALLARAPGPQQAHSRQIADLTERLANVGLPAAQRQALQDQRQQLEQQLYRQLPALQPRLVEPTSVARALPTDGVLIEFQRFQPFDGRASEAQRWGEPRYLALVLQPTGAITASDLGPASAIDPLIREALAVSEKGERPADPLWQQVAGKVLAPLMPQLEGRRRWFLSPDGELNRIPYAALSDPRNPSQRLVQSVQLRLLTTGRDLLAADSAPSPQRPLVVAGPDFGGARPWSALPAAAQEGQLVARQLSASLIEGTAATADALQRARGPKVLHVASHGFFLPSASGADPLLDSGLVLAGANRSGLPNQRQTSPPTAPRAKAPPSRSSADDGYLTAKEAAQLQLDGTQLVVLSACDTGSGTPQGGEGVYGLQRALTVAGARSTLLSLWKVDDAATAQFMRRFYDLLKGGRTRMDALVEVQEEFRSNPPVRDWRDHKYWAAWQLTGDTAPLPGL
jgi:CHAT domain-containing protein/tetratricopeptide (TPR) repeat protein